jgi:hypothetical protein
MELSLRDLHEHVTSRLWRFARGLGSHTAPPGLGLGLGPVLGVRLRFLGGIGRADPREGPPGSWCWLQGATPPTVQPHQRVNQTRRHKGASKH